MSQAAPVFSAVPTLFDTDGEVDTGANRALYKLLDGLLDGLLVAGTTGEFPALDDAERLSLIELALAEAGPDRVIAHVGAPDARHTARLARAATALGATRLAAITPYYLPARPDELISHYCRIRDAVPAAELYAYIFSERTGLRVPPPVFASAAEAAGLAGAKLSGSTASDLAQYVAAAPGLRFYSGDDSHPGATMRAGGAGLISGRSSAYPEVYAALGAALAAGDQDAAARHQLVLDRVVALGASIGRLKHAVALRGLGGTTARMTVDPPGPELAAAIAAAVTEVAALLHDGCEPTARVPRLLSRGSGESGRRASDWLGNRAGAEATGPARAGTGQLAGASGAPGLAMSGPACPGRCYRSIQAYPAYLGCVSWPGRRAPRARVRSARARRSLPARSPRRPSCAAGSGRECPRARRRA
jgi:4-hydroxy-tetrahydrodipicolinate synthase